MTTNFGIDTVKFRGEVEASMGLHGLGVFAVLMSPPLIAVQCVFLATPQASATHNDNPFYHAGSPCASGRNRAQEPVEWRYGSSLGNRPKYRNAIWGALVAWEGQTFVDLGAGNDLTWRRASLPPTVTGQTVPLLYGVLGDDCWLFETRVDLNSAVLDDESQASNQNTAAHEFGHVIGLTHT